MKILIAHIGLVVVSLGLIGAGLWLVHPGSALATVGGLLWLDMSLVKRRPVAKRGRGG